VALGPLSKSDAFSGFGVPATGQGALSFQRACALSARPPIPAIAVSVQAMFSIIASPLPVAG
jgi:hypothetical protein